MKISVKLLGSSALVLGLAACGGGGDSGLNGVSIGAEEAAARVFSDDAGTIGEAIDAGETITTRAVSQSAWIEDYSNPEPAYRPVDSNLSVEAVPGGLRVTFVKADGTSESFDIPQTELGGSSYFRDEGGVLENFFVGNGLVLEDLLDPSTTDYAVRFGLYYEDRVGDDFGTEVRGVIGTETRADEIDSMIAMGGDASYSGFGILSYRQDGEFFSEFNGRLRGDVSLDVDFDTARLSGEWTNLELEDREGSIIISTENPAGAILFNRTVFNANGFEGTMSPDPVLAADLASGSPEEQAFGAFAGSLEYSGTFYGPDGQEIAGALSGRGTVGGDTFTAAGSFSTAIDTP